MIRASNRATAVATPAARVAGMARATAWSTAKAMSGTMIEAASTDRGVQK